MALITKYPLLSLFLLAIICGIFWRVEVENHGWSGLTWLTYFHVAVPLGYTLFLVWSNLFIKTNRNTRIFLNLVAIIYGIIIYYMLGTSLTYIFAQGPHGFIILISTPNWKFNLFRNSIFIIIPFIPIGAFLMLKIFKQVIKIKFLILSIASMMISVPISTIILEIIDHKGGHDHIHAIKSGIIIPLWVISVGLLIIGLKYSNQNGKHLDPENTKIFDV